MSGVNVRRILILTVYALLISFGGVFYTSAQVNLDSAPVSSAVSWEQYSDWYENPSVEEANVILSNLEALNHETGVSAVSSSDIKSIRDVFYKLSSNPKPLKSELQFVLNDLGILSRDKKTTLSQKTKLEETIKKLLKNYPALELETSNFFWKVTDEEKETILDLLSELGLNLNAKDTPSLTDETFYSLKFLLTRGSISLFTKNGALSQKNTDIIKGKLTNYLFFENSSQATFNDGWIEKFTSELIPLAPKSLNISWFQYEIEMNIRPSINGENPKTLMFNPEVSPYIKDEILKNFIFDPYRIGFPAPPPEKEIRWEKNPITLCFDGEVNLSTAMVGEEFNIHFTIAKAAREWGKVSGVKIELKSKNDCQIMHFMPTGSVENIRYMSGSVNYSVTEKKDDFASADARGRNLAQSRGLIFKSKYRPRDPICGEDIPNGNEKCAFADALHELGHLLGFSHDHLNPKAPRCHAVQVSKERPDLSMTYYDPKSIMNYCNPTRWEGKLSKADICSVQVAYPKEGYKHRTAEECEMIAKSTVIISAQ